MRCGKGGVRQPKANRSNFVSFCLPTHMIMKPLTSHRRAHRPQSVVKQKTTYMLLPIYRICVVCNKSGRPGARIN